MNIIEHYLYTKEHEWIHIEGNVGTLGITDYAQSALGDITFIDLPVMDKEVKQSDQLLAVESVKSASDIFSPLSGRVIEVNDALTGDPSLLNQHCYDQGWIARIRISNQDETRNLLTAAEYLEYLGKLDGGEGRE